ncbi:retrovirus-related pol polyprotein from transposon TNT 1-94 [Tanacetum coccineum]|uniref:Retrovirus-related pol polyprotein from transposon TNT 1-94 n=1 Tax=Tanacetum coccineum TaxID=301880 RepID=A0ABQ5CBH1_9ASTR
MHDKKPDLSFFHVFGALCYPTNDNDDLGKLNAKADAKADIGIFVGYAPAKKAFRIYNRRTGIITETIHVTFNELTTMAYEQFSSGPGLQHMTLATSSTRLVSNPVSQQPLQEALAPRSEALADSPVSTSIDQDAPLTSIPTSQNKNILQSILKVKTDESGGVLKNKARLVAQGFKQEEGQPLHVYKLKKALYGLKQAPRAWYDMLSSFLISQQFSKGAVDPTLFTWHAGNDKLLVQIYVDDIIFASTNTAICDEFANQMTSKFKMSMMGQMSFFLGLQISQSPRGIFINQSKYASEIVKKYGLNTTDSVDTPIIETKKLDKDLKGKPVYTTLYHGMIGSLMYLTATYVDANHAGCQDTRRSTSGSAQFLGDKLVSWSSQEATKSMLFSSTKLNILLVGSAHKSYGCVHN